MSGEISDEEIELFLERCLWVFLFWTAGFDPEYPSMYPWPR